MTSWILAMIEPLYIKRQILNHEDIQRWAKSQGFTRVVHRNELHITQAFIHTPVDTSRVTPLANELLLQWEPQYFRQIVHYGASVSLKFFDHTLKQRNRDIHALVEVPESKKKKFRPHFAITYWDIPDLTHCEPYQGDIHLGPEVIMPLDPHYQVQEETI